jgi:hypothetical protein
MGLILDSSVVIAAEHQAKTVTLLLRRIASTAGDQRVALSAVGSTNWKTTLGTGRQEKTTGKSTESNEYSCNSLQNKHLLKENRAKSFPVFLSNSAQPLLPFPSLRVHSSGALREPFLQPPVQALLEYSFL